MKRTITSIILLVCIFILCGCNSKVEDNNEDKSNSANKDLISKELGIESGVYISIPSWRESSGENYLVLQNSNYFIISVISSESNLEDLYNNEVTSILNTQVDRGKYSKLLGMTTNEIKINKNTSINFNGNIERDSYGTVDKFDVYGYFLNYENKSIIIMSIETNIGGNDLNTQKDKENTNKYVDDIVKSIRSTK